MVSFVIRKVNSYTESQCCNVTSPHNNYTYNFLLLVNQKAQRTYRFYIHIEGLFEEALECLIKLIFIFINTLIKFSTIYEIQESLMANISIPNFFIIIIIKKTVSTIPMGLEWLIYNN